jgi:hypothetical protein
MNIDVCVRERAVCVRVFVCVVCVCVHPEIFFDNVFEYALLWQVFYSVMTRSRPDQTNIDVQVSFTCTSRASSSR